MDDDVLNMPNWGYYEPFRGGHLGLQLMPGMTERDTKPFLPGRDPAMLMGANGTFHPRDCVVSEAPMPLNYVRDSWINQRDRFFHMQQPTNPNYAVLPETSGAPNLKIIQPPDTSRDEKVDRVEEVVVKKELGKSKKRHTKGALSTPKAKKPRKPKDNSNVPVQRAKPPKKTMELVINGIDMDISDLPIPVCSCTGAPTPVCSCTGAPQQCYRWGCGGWQSACCTTNVSIYPLPMSMKRRGARIAGRKMSQGAFKKVLEKLAAEGYNFANPIDLKTHWARHGTNKFVTIR
ncbi:Protein BASIC PENTACYSTEINE1 [Glycine soja]|uniref:GAGA-binding transcriptional activator n=1 Tax=Glycine soja TaxID=3848 RepID=A0A0B2R9R8_GLYSO|nr:Protein BASIC PENTACYSTEINE1 [Glycine soja]